LWGCYNEYMKAQDKQSLLFLYLGITTYLVVAFHLITGIYSR